MYRWAGDRCTEPGAVCEGDYACLNQGSCTGFRKCTCPPDWRGDQCQNATCRAGCNPVGGSCTNTPGACVCTLPHQGVTCNECSDGYYLDDETQACRLKQTAGYCDRFDSGATYSNISGQCDCSPLAWYFPRCDRRCPKCPADFRQTGGCLGQQGVECSACSKCTAGSTYARGGCDGGTSDTECADCKICDPGTFYSGGCVDNVDTLCRSKPSEN